ncbi:hypothetical protein DSO57_1023091 [Entomophthora muscae]|uniref:Uncharacterized protein n=1 Tax=Entomophthora muscae TaxID=34485 RepID=A0ACC2SFT8_9FUNG|nr:hypothetical protein DSO57_1023091 [Entomophthora muscae]
MVALLGPHRLDQYQMIKGSHNSRTFLDFLRAAKEYLWINYRGTTKIVVLDNVGLHKVDLVVSEFQPINKNSHSASHRLADCLMRLLFLLPHSSFLNLIKEVFGWIKNKVKQGLPQDTEDLFNILEISQFAMPPNVVLAFYKHLESFLPKALAVMVDSIMPGIVCPSKKAWKAGKLVSKLTELTDLNQTVDQKWVTAAPVRQLKPVPPFKLTLIN